MMLSSAGPQLRFPAPTPQQQQQQQQQQQSCHMLAPRNSESCHLLPQE